MTTLADGRSKLLEQYTPENCPDKTFRERMRNQIMAITTGANAYFAWLALPEKEKRECGSIENHSRGTELCLSRWFETKAAQVWGNAHNQ